MTGIRLPDNATSAMGRLTTLSTSTKVALSICGLVFVGIWNHYETSLDTHPFQQGVWIQWLSWALITGISKASEQSDRPNSPTVDRQSFWSSTSTIWLTSMAAIISQLLSVQHELTWTLPLTTILVTLSTYFTSKRALERDDDDKEKQADFPSPSVLNFADHHVLKEHLQLSLPMILNVACFVLLLDYQQIVADRLATLHSVSFLITRSIAIFGIARLQHSSGEDQSAIYNSAVRRTLSRLSMPMMTLLTLQLVVVRPDLQAPSGVLALHAVAQAIWWLSIVTLARLQLVNTAANSDTIAMSGLLALISPDVRSVVLALSSGLFSITQTLIVLQPGPNVRKIVYALTVLFILVAWQHQNPELTKMVSPSSLFAPKGQIFQGHPIEALIVENRERFADVLQRQSRTLHQAVKEYQRRYGRDPPAGFDRWFEIAQENQFVLVDEFDTVMQSMEPMHGIDPAILKQRLDKALLSPDVFYRACIVHFKKGKMTFGSTDEVTGSVLMEESWLDAIPYNMTVALNYFDEPMVSAPWDAVKQAMQSIHHEWNTIHKADRGQNFTKFLDLGKQNVWSATRVGCPIDSPSRTDVCGETTYRGPFGFVNNATQSKDTCSNCDIKTEHGLMLQPDSLRVTTELTPIWSASKPSHFHDMLYPSPYYITTRDNYKENLDIAWEDKDNKFYWVGRATGGYASKEFWDKFQRQRLALKTSPSNTEPIQLLEEVVPDSNKYTPRNSTMDGISELFDVRIAAVLQCPEEACQIEKEAFGLTEDVKPDPLEAAYAHKFVFDIDGNGFSGRYYRLLRSRSVVIKSTILKEWHDDFLFPWVHYVPLSTGYHELPEMARFLATTKRGLQLSKRIARESTQWHNRSLRNVDLKIVWLRLLLEYGRLFNPEMTFTL